jgi:outer membrane receptor protein involved in Fe transport
VWRDLLAVRRTGVWGGARWTTGAWGVGRDEALADPLDEIGIGTEQVHDRSGSVGGVAQLAVVPTRGLRADGVLDLRLDGWGRVGEPDLRASRRVARLGLGGAGFGRGWSVEPGLWVLAFDDREGDASVPRVSALPRVAARMQVAPPLSVHGQLGRAVRPPDLDELFGDRGAWVGNPDLRAEQAWNADAGADLAGDAWSVSAVGFWTEATDRIVFVQNAQQVAQPINLAAASLRGVEVGGAVGGRGVDASLAATWTDARQRSADPTYDGNPIPRVPAWEIQSALSGTRGPLQLGWTGSFVAGTWLDSAGFQRAGPRWIHGAFGRLTFGSWAMTIDIRNVANRIAEVGPRDPLVDDGAVAVRAMTDFLGYPLPGRVALVGLVWSR